MNEINLQKKENFISNCYDSLNKILFEYYKYLIDSLKLSNKKSKEYIFYIIELFNLKKEIENVNFDSNLDCSGGYCFENKELIINFDDMVKFCKLDIIDRPTLLIEYFTTLLHEMIHAMQYKSLINDDESLMSKMKKVSIELKKIFFDNIVLHDLFPDEREANVESSKMLYNFFRTSYIENFKNSEDNLIFYLVNGYYKKINGLYVSPISRFYGKKIKYIIEKDCDIKKFSNYEKLLYGFELNVNLQNKLEISRETKSIDSGLVKILKL